ncbi:MAG: DHH family phosphoesterase [Euryarchaeota archaeon]|nr:DHH family phosphoesterase [Euryarchaeota archaeon]
MSEKMDNMILRASQCADEIHKHSKVQCVSHIDADGITSASIMCTALKRAGIEYDIRFVRQLDEAICDELGSQDHELVIFTDLGSGQIGHIRNNRINSVIVDHHRPQGDIDNHLNPHLFGINGSVEISGAGTSYILASQLGNNIDLAGLAIVGAIGDMQNRKYGKLVSLNREILDEGIKNNIVAAKTDITLFGKQTRPLYKLLQYASDPYLPGLTGSEDACIEFLHDAGMRFAKDEKWRRWIDLTDDEKKRIISILMQYGLSNGLPAYKVSRLVGEGYLLLNETEGTEMRDATEFSTLLNATGRYEHANVGMSVCMGDRDAGYEQASSLLKIHRKNLVDGLNFVKEQGMTQLDHLQYFDAGDRIPDTIVGIVAGMSYSISGNRRVPIIAFADKDDGYKVSARGNQDLVRRGLDLSMALETICSQLGGAGGGHDIAAGATVPFGKKDEFIQKLNAIIGTQLDTSA